MRNFTLFAATGRRLAVAAAAALLLAGCGPSQEDGTGPRTNRRADPLNQGDASVFGPGGVSLFGQEATSANAGTGGSGIAVNSFLWRATLDTLSFIPLASADPFGGVIITDWYSPPEAPDERFKVNVYILDGQLRADGVRAAVFRQQVQGGRWVDAAVEPRTATDLENAILTRARQFRIAQAR